MESDMDRWIQDRDRLSKQLEKCQMKYDSAVASQKVQTISTNGHTGEPIDGLHCRHVGAQNKRQICLYSLHKNGS